jgi:hypothetical protein
MWRLRDLAWLAGLFEGEGYVMTTDRALNLLVNMTDEDVVRKAQAVGGFGSVSGPIMGRKPNHRPTYRWKVSKRDEVYALAVALYPFLGERRRAAIRQLVRKYGEMRAFAWLSHGTVARYNHHGCLCDACRAAGRDDRHRRQSGLVSGSQDPSQIG